MHIRGPFLKSTLPAFACNRRSITLERKSATMAHLVIIHPDCNTSSNIDAHRNTTNKYDQHYCTQ